MDFSALRNLLINGLKEKALAALVAKVPFFGWKVVNPIAGFIVELILKELFDKGALTVNWLWSIAENQAELKDAIKSREALKNILAQGGDSTAAEDEFDESTDDLIRRNHDRIPR